MGRNFVNRVYPNRICVICNGGYIPTNSVQKACKGCQRILHSRSAVISARKRRQKFYEERGFYPEDKQALQKYSAGWYANLSPEKQLHRSIRSRALQKKLSFDLELTDMIAPETCPVLGCKLERGRGSNQRNSPSVDRIDPSKGYTKDNIQIISLKANGMKQDASVEELQRFADWVNKTYPR